MWAMLIPMIMSAIQQSQSQQGGQQGGAGGQASSSGLMGGLGSMMGGQGGGASGGGGGSSGGLGMFQPGLLGGQFGFSQQGQALLGGVGSLLAGQKVAGGYEDYERNMQAALGMLKGDEQKGLGYLQPFQTAGTQAIPQIQKSLALLQDPVAARKYFGTGYETSPGAQMSLETGQRAAESAASASGTLGSGAQKAALQEFGQKLQASDVDKYIQEQQGTYMQGLQGLMGQEQLGESAGQSMQGFLAQLAQMQAQAYGAMGQGKVGEAQARAGGMTGAISDIGSLL